MTFIFSALWYFIPMIFVFILLPKLLCMRDFDSYYFKLDKVKRKHLFMGIICGILPVVNILILLFSAILWCVVFYDVIPGDGDWWEEPLFKKEDTK